MVEVPEKAKLAFACAGIFFSFSYFAVLQEDVYKKPYSGEYFKYTFLALVCERGINAAIGALGVLLLGGSDVLAQTAELRTELQGAAAHNKAQLAASLRGVEMLQGPDGADPKLLAMSKLHMVGEVLGALFERLHKRDAKQARAQAVCGGQAWWPGAEAMQP